MSARFLCIWFAVVLAGAFASRGQLRAASAQHCAFDGEAFSPTARVDVLVANEPGRSFCSPECALAFAATVTSAPLRFEVHDETDAAPLDPAAATFVRSGLRSGTGRGVLRAFRDPVLASEHARIHGGDVVPNPFPAPTR